ncbi:MAG: DNA polymerase I [Phycisphaerales bacterium]|jgi:DNA polymerase-1|nr:DNA polymerase I [Phycisphaerales bacterium]
MAKKSFYIIDGHAHIYRSYFAPFRDLTSPAGEPTKATYVFTQMLLNLVRQRKPDYLAMVIDSGDETVFRKDIYPQYKANRKERPADFEPQEQRILRIVKDAGVPIFVVPGFEADDLIATMAKRLQGGDWDVYIVSKDKDLRQILNDGTFMYDVQGDEVIDAAMIEQKHGYTPAEAVEVQTLMGDTTDNVPGIPGIGEKTAAKLINKYGRADAVLDHLNELTPKMRESFEKHRDNLALARPLVTLKNDVKFDFDPESCIFRGLNAAGLRPHFQELGFTGLLSRLEDQASAPQSPKTAWFNESLFGDLDKAKPDGSSEGILTAEGCDYRLVATENDFVDFMKQLRSQKRFAFDTETDDLGAMNSNMIGMSFSWKHGQGFYIPVRGPAGSEHLECQRVLRDIKPILEDSSIKKVGHNLKYDLLVMRQAGVRLNGIELDSMVAMFLIDPGRMQYGIDRLALELLNFRKVATAELIGKGKQQISMERVELGRVAQYASEDADIALRLADLLQARLKQLPAVKKLNDELETPLINVLAEMERNGIAVDPKVLKEQSEVLGERIETLREQIMSAAGCEFNPDSPKQLAEVLFNKLKLKIVKRTKTGASTDVEVLEKLASEHPCPKLILEYRSLVKLKNTYLDNLTEYVNPKTGRIHTSFNQTGAATGRLSSSDPNLQNIPIRTDEGRRIRSAFVPGDREHNVLLTADYSQIELRMLAHFTHEPALMKAFDRDEDIHRAVAAEVFGVPLDQVSREQRAQAKIINFGIIYGVSAYGLAKRIDGLSIPAAEELIASYHKRFPSIHKFLQKCVMDAQAHGYVETIMGRRRPIPEISSAVVSLRNAGERMAINSVVQGSAADLIKIAMLNVHDCIQREGRPSKMLLQVHDELVFETPANVAEEEAAMVRRLMVDAGKQLGLIVPLKVESGWGKNWQEVK